MQVLKGIGVSGGIGIGTALVVGRHERRVPRYRIRPDEIPRELRRFQSARRLAREEINALRERAAGKLGPKYAGIFDAHLLILDDRRLGREATESIRKRHRNVEWALASTVNRLLSSFESVDDPYLRERGGDIRDVHERLQRILGGAANHHDRELQLSEPTVVIAHALNPSDAIWLNQPMIVGFATARGSRTSHTAILAGALKLPAVVAIDGLLEAVREGETVVVDGAAGELAVDPSAGTLLAYQQARDERARAEVEVAADRGPVATRDGVAVRIAANVEFPEEIASVEAVGAHGIGLYRSEFLFLAKAPALPDEEAHVAAYRALAAAALDGPIVIRTLDLGGEKALPGRDDEDETNPVLGLRAVRYCLARPDIFRLQLRGLFRVAAETGRIWIMVPMISGVGEWRSVTGFVEQVRLEMEREGLPAPRVPLGCMIEVPAAALVADHLAREADFFSIGSNDLIQYTLAIDRGNAAVSYLHDPWHPAVLRLVQRTIEAGRVAGIPVGFCGEMAADPLGAVTLLGLGVTNFSCGPGSIQPLRAVVRALEAREARAAVESALEAPTGAEVRARLEALFGPRLAGQRFAGAPLGGGGAAL